MFGLSEPYCNEKNKRYRNSCSMESRSFSIVTLVEEMKLVVTAKDDLKFPEKARRILPYATFGLSTLWSEDEEFCFFNQKKSYKNETSDSHVHAGSQACSDREKRISISRRIFTNNTFSNFGTIRGQRQETRSTILRAGFSTKEESIRLRRCKENWCF